MKRWLPALLIVLAVAVVYGPVLHHDFTNYDDLQTIAGNADLTPPTWEGLKHIWTTPLAGLYVPLTYSLWWCVAFFAFHDGHMNAVSFHLLSLLLHASCGLIAWRILRSLRCDLLSATVGAMLFVLHPTQVETVAWASGAKDQLAAFFSLLAIQIYAHRRPSACVRGEGGGESLDAASDRSGSEISPTQSPFPNPLPGYREREEGRGLFRLSAIAVCLFLAMLAKPLAIVTPLILAAIDLLYFDKPMRVVAARWAWTALLILPILLIARAVQGDYPDVATPLWQRPLIAGDALAFYLVKIIWPATLTHLYGRTPMRVGASPLVYWTWLLPTLSLLVLLGAARRKPLVLTGATVFLIALLPVLGLTPFEFQIHSTVADHYLYLPMFGVALAAAGVLNDRTVSTQATNIVLPACTLILALLAVRSATQLRVWQDSVSLNTHAVVVTPWSFDAHGSLGVALAEAGRVTDAVPQFEFVAQQLPQNWTAHVRLAQAYLTLHQFDRALPHAAVAVQLTRDRNIFPRLLLADALIGSHRRDDALRQLRIAEQISPNDPAIAARIERLESGSATRP